ncbi:EAL domain-containing protein [Vibrio profundum]|uniref:bifunctional diguanylate cyclase/phosphodiesterase n=1 Tax=Vibrio profundum TaxID=2910247 RepID=UPI003D0B36BE
MQLKGKIAASLLPIVLLQMVILIVPTFMFYSDHTSEQIELHIQDSVAQARSAVNSKLSSLSANTAVFAKNAILNRYLRVDNPIIRANVMHDPLLSEFASYMAVHPDYLEISLVAPDGYKEATLTSKNYPNTLDEAAGTSYFKSITQSLSNHKVLITKDPTTQQWILVSAQKILQRSLIEQTQASEPTLKGYLVIKLNLDFLSAQLSSTKWAQDGFVALYDNKGQLILKTGEASITPSALESLFQKEQHGSGTYIHQISVNNNTYVTGSSQLADNLNYSIAWPNSELHQVLISLGYTSIVNGLILLVASMLLVYWVLNRKLIRPIHDLSLSAMNLGKGEEVWEFKSNSNDEISSLADAIKDMGFGLIRQKQQLHDIAYIDSLTKLPNRHQMLEDLNQQYSQLKMGLHGDIALLFLDLDEFKHINDTMGHEAGDKILTAVANRLKYALSTVDSGNMTNLTQPIAVNNAIIADNKSEQPNYQLCRLGGDEFTVLLLNIKDRHDVEQVAELILHAFHDPFRIADREFRLGVSVGIALASESGESTSDLLKNADIAMYDAKKEGKNTYRFFSRSSALKSLKEMEIKEDLHHALYNNELTLAFQPQISIEDNTLAGCEALLRWKHPDKGWIRPDIFIPIAEQSGLIAPLGKWVILETCRQIKRWQKAGYQVPRVSINVSSVQFSKENMHRVIVQSLKDTGISTKYLAVEVTESSIMQGADSIAQLEKIQAEGIRIALDDFGTGYSSLSALRGLPIDELKIDKSFVSDLSSGSDGKAIVSAIIAMAHQLGLEVVAEGVETKEELDFLKQKSAEIIQGYYFSKPLTKEEFTMQLVSHSAMSKQSSNGLWLVR